MHVFKYVSVERQDPSAISDWLRLRTDLYLECGFIADSDLSEGNIYRDDYDEYSEHILVFDAELPEVAIGTCRIIDGSRGRLQITDQFGISAHQASLEVSGFAIDKVYRKTMASLGCYKLVHSRASLQNISEVYFEVEEAFGSSLHSLGLPVQTKSEPKYFYNTLNVAVSVHIPDVVRSLHEADERRGGTAFAEYFSQEWDGLLDTASLLRDTKERPVVDLEAAAPEAEPPLAASGAE